MLSYLEYRTAAIYHATDEALRPLDRVQDSFLEALGITPKEAILDYNLAPLSTRRDIAMLGVIYRSVRGGGPSQMTSFFKPDTERIRNRRHAWPLKTFRRGLNDWTVLERSVLGLIDVWNMLPVGAVLQPCVSSFQGYLQEMVKHCEHDEWKTLLSPRHCVCLHPLLSEPSL